MTRTPRDQLCVNQEKSQLYDKLLSHQQSRIEAVTNIQEVIAELERLLNLVDHLHDLDYRRYWR